MRGEKVALSSSRPFEDAIYPGTVSFREKVTRKYSRRPVLIKELRRRKMEDPR